MSNVSVVLMAVLVLAPSAQPSGPATAADKGLIVHLKLAGDCKDYSGQGNHGVNHGVSLAAADGATFNGVDQFIEVPNSERLKLGKHDFSVSVWVHTEAELKDVLGDILSKYNPATRTGVTLSIMNYAGVTTTQSNYRNLSFGIDAGRADREWTDCGRPGNARFVTALAVCDGHLYAGTYEEGENETGHVYRYDGGTTWTDCGFPHKANTVGALAVYQGKLYAGSTRYYAMGSLLPNSLNRQPGGKVCRYEGGTQWTDCGKLGKSTRGAFSMAVFAGKLYASPVTERGLYRYDGGQRWTDCGNPGHRTGPLTVYNGVLFAGSYDHVKPPATTSGYVFRYDGQTWTTLNQVPKADQLYSLIAYEGKLHVGQWPDGLVFVYDAAKDQWTSVGRLGKENEVMGISVYNGKLYAGTLPLGQVYRYDGPDRWTLTGQLDATPKVTYRRVWSMAVYQGKLFAGTLPAGRVLSFEAGRCATHDRELAPGWRHVAAVKAGGLLKLYVDGQCVATSSAFDSADYDLSTPAPLRIGFGQHDYFNGRLSDLRLYARALTAEEVQRLHANRTTR
jgi:gamma-glutamylcyclotransferase (GGCT)/AIG2-like uncharacterized protein YtfP